jgi:iron(III) transport system permease protein
LQDSRVAAPTALHGAQGWLAMLACLVPVTFGFLVPASFLAREAISQISTAGFDWVLVHHSLTTFFFAGCATGAILLLGFAAAIAVRLVPRPFISGSVTFATLGYAIPGTVLALGLLGPLVAIDDIINWFSRNIAGVSVGLIVAGSSAAVIVGDTVRDNCN